MVFTISASLAGAAGALYSHNYATLTPAGDKFNYHASIMILVYVVLGGIGNIRGSVIAAIVLYILPEKLRFIGDCRAAPANIDTDACTAHGVPVLCTPGRNNQAVAELVVGLIIMQLRNAIPAIQWAKDGKWVEGTTPYYLWMGHELQGRKVGFVGFGAVGRAAAKIMDGFDCDICFYDPFIPNDIGHYKKTELEKIFAECDIVSLHLPVTDETRGMIDEKLLRSMKPTALFVNSARSAVVDTKALIKLLNDKAIAGAIIDVLDTEPPTAEDLQIAYCPNTILTPHIGGSSFEVTVHQADILNERIRQWLKGENLERIVFNRAVLAK